MSTSRRGQENSTQECRQVDPDYERAPKPRFEPSRTQDNNDPFARVATHELKINARPHDQLFVERIVQYEGIGDTFV